MVIMILIPCGNDVLPGYILKNSGFLWSVNVVESVGLKAFLRILFGIIRLIKAACYGSGFIKASKSAFHLRQAAGFRHRQVVCLLGVCLL